jgi:hypothetical protein
MVTLEPAFFLGLGAVAVWFYLRFPRLRPQSITRAIVHVAISFTLFSLVPYAIGPSMRSLPPALSLLVVIAGFVIPTLGYVLLSWVWLIAKVHDLGNSLPRGGHRVRSSER